MKNSAEYNHIVKNEIEQNKIEARKILDKLENKFDAGSIVVAHHFNHVSSDLIKTVKSELELAGFKPEFVGNKPNGHIVMRVSLIKSAILCN